MPAYISISTSVNQMSMEKLTFGTLLKCATSISTRVRYGCVNLFLRYTPRYVYIAAISVQPRLRETFLTFNTYS